jgi:hypothetical protein
MDNPEKLTTLGTQDTWRRHAEQKIQHRKLKQYGPHQKQEVKICTSANPNPDYDAHCVSRNRIKLIPV